MDKQKKQAELAATAAAPAGPAAATGDASPTGGSQAGNTTSDASNNPVSDPRMASAVKTLNAGFGEAVALLMRDEKHRHLGLADLEWLLLPPLTTNQALILRGKVRGKEGDTNGQTVPLGLALWANASKEVDQKLEAQMAAGAPLRLAPRDWTSGDIPWLVLRVAPKELREKLVAKVGETLGTGMKVFEAN